VVPRNRQHGASEPLQERRRALVLVAPAAVGEIAARDDQLHVDAVDQRCQSALHFGGLKGSRMEIRNMEESCRHLRID
jgi:hypothetical protein